MHVHRRWLKLALVTIALMFALADPQVYTMRSDLDGSSRLNSDANSNFESSTPIPQIPLNSSKTNERLDRTPQTPSVKDSRTQTLTEKNSRPATTLPDAAGRTSPASSDNVPAPRSQNIANLDNNFKPGSVVSSPDLNVSLKSTAKPIDTKTFAKPTVKPADLKTTTNPAVKPTELDTPVKQTATNTKAAKETETPEVLDTTPGGSAITFSKSPYLKLAGPLPDSIPTVSDDTINVDETSLKSDSTYKSDHPESHSLSTIEPTTTSLTSKENTSDLPLETDSTTPSKASKQTDAPEYVDVDETTQTSDTTPSAPLTPERSSSPTSVMTDVASDDETGMSNNLMLGFMMVGAVVLVAVVAIFVYVRTKENNDGDDEIDSTTRGSRFNGDTSTAQPFIMTTKFHGNNDMSSQRPRDAYGHHLGHDSSINYNDPNIDVLTPRSQISIARSHMSLPPMAQTGYSNGSSQYSNFTTQSKFYGDSAYSTDFSSVSQVANNYPGMRKGTRENDISGSEDESDYESDSFQSNARNNWNAVARSGDRAVSRMDDSMAESQFKAADTRSTSASDYSAKQRMQESNYTEYRVSTDYDNSYVGGDQGYDKSFAGTKNDCDKSRHAAGRKSFESSGFSQYDSTASSHIRSSSSFYQTNESRFTDASYK